MFLLVFASNSKAIKFLGGRSRGGLLAGLPALWAQLIVKAGDVELIPGPKKSSREDKLQQTNQRLLPFGGWVHKKCRNLENVKNYSGDYICGRAICVA